MKAVKKKSGKAARLDAATLIGSKTVHELLEEVYPSTQCPLCLCQESSKTKAETHYREQHKGQRGYHCMDGSCTHSFSSRPGLLYHLQVVHAPKNDLSGVPKVKDIKVKDKIKDKVTESNTKNPPLDENLAKQLELQYNPLVCPLCNERFPKKTQTIVHINKYHHKEKLFHCFVKHCPHEQGFGSLQALAYHLAKH